MKTNQGFDKHFDYLQLSIFCDLKRLHASKTLCLTLHGPFLPDAVGQDQDCSHEHHGQSLLFSIKIHVNIKITKQLIQIM